VGSGQLFFPDVLFGLDAYMRKTRFDWEQRAIHIEDFPLLASNAHIWREKRALLAKKRCVLWPVLVLS
jgi:hypothetical protein